MTNFEELARKRVVLDCIIEHKLNAEESAKYAEEQGVVIRMLTFERATTSEQYEAGQRFVSCWNEADFQTAVQRNRRA